MKIIKISLSFVLLFTNFVVAQPLFKNQENGLCYTIISNPKSKLKPFVKKGESIAFSMKQKLGDSIVYNSFDAGHQLTTVDGLKQHLDFKFLFSKVKVGDSMIVGINVDTVYQKQVSLSKQSDPNFNEETFKATVPSFFLNPKNYVIFEFKILDKFINNKKDKNCAIDTKRKNQYLKKQTAKQTAYEQKMQQEELKKMTALSGPNKEKGKNFMAENKKINGVKETPSGLQYYVIKEGSGNAPNINNSVICHYFGTTINGVEFDNSYKRGEPLEFAVNGVIAGWTEILQKMNVGSKYKVWIPSSLAYGETGAGDAIGPGETLIFEIELLNIK